jgi:hypothetical protein
MFLRAGELMLAGEKPYVDFFEFYPPGSLVITAAWLGVAGISILSARSLAILTMVGIACFTYLACRQASKNATSSVLLALGWLIMSIGGPWTQVSHHWFSTLFSMIVIWATLASIERSGRWLRGSFIAGFAAGAVAMVTTHQGALVMLAGATAFGDLRRHSREFIAYCFGSAIVPACMLGYVISYGGLRDAFQDVIIFPLTQYSVSWVPYAAATTWQNLPLKYLFPFAGLLTTLACLGSWRTCFRDRILRSCIAFGIAGAVSILPCPGIYQITFLAPLTLPVVAYCGSQIARSWFPKYHYAAAAVVIGLCLPSALSFALKAHRALGAELVSTPRGNVTFFGGEESARALIAWVDATPTEDAFLFYPRDSLATFLTGRRQVSKYDMFAPAFTSGRQFKEACVSAMQHASWAVIDRSWTDLGFLRSFYPRMPDTMPLETQRFEQAVERGFQFVARKGEFEIRRRITSVDESVCAGIDG